MNADIAPPSAVSLKAPREVPANRFLSALRELPESAHGPRVDIVYESLVVNKRVPIEQSGMSNVAKSVVDFVTFASFRKNTSTDLQILAGQSGTLRAGTSTLIIGTPYAGTAQGVPAVPFASRVCLPQVAPAPAKPHFSG